MNADENKMIIGVYLRSSAAHKRFFLLGLILAMELAGLGAGLRSNPGGTKRKTLNLFPGTADYLQEEDDASGRDCAAGRCAGRYRSRARPARHDDARGAAARRRLRNRHFTKRGREYRYLHRRCALRLR